MHQYILGKLIDYVIRHEWQGREPVHAHIILWVNENDLQKITNETIVVVLAIFDETTKNFIPPSDSLQNK